MGEENERVGAHWAASGWLKCRLALRRWSQGQKGVTSVRYRAKEQQQDLMFNLRALWTRHTCRMHVRLGVPYAV